MRVARHSIWTGQNIVLGWSDPVFRPRSVAKMVGVAPAQHEGAVARVQESQLSVCNAFCSTGNHSGNPIPMNISPTHLDALETHSDYFLARRFLAFTAAHWGYRTHTFGCGSCRENREKHLKAVRTTL